MPKARQRQLLLLFRQLLQQFLPAQIKFFPQCRPLAQQVFLVLKVSLHQALRLLQILVCCRLAREQQRLVQLPRQILHLAQVLAPVLGPVLDLDQLDRPTHPQLHPAYLMQQVIQQVLPQRLDHIHMSSL